MKSSTIKTFSIIIAISFIIALFYIVVGLIFDNHNGIFDATDTFTNIYANTERIASQYSVSSPDFKSLFVQNLDSVKSYDSCSLYSGDSLLYNDNENSHFMNSLFLKVFSKKIISPEKSELTITVSFNTLSPLSVYKRARVSFLIILAGTLFAWLLLFLNNIKNPNSSEIINESDRNNDTADDNSDIISELEDNSLSGENLSFPDNDILSDNSDNTQIDTKENISETVLPVSDNTVLSIPKSNQLEKALDEELIRAASAEQDLSLVIIRIRSLDREMDIGKSIASLLINNCDNQVLVFEYQNDGYALIFRNTALDSAFSSAEKIYDDIRQTISSSTVSQIGIGISARTLRLISGSRLITEADKATERALQDQESPIIAFRVNPEKYRKFVAENNN